MKGYLRNAQREIKKMKKERDDNEIVTVDLVLDWGGRDGRDKTVIPVKCTRALARKVVESHRNRNQGWNMPENVD